MDKKNKKQEDQTTREVVIGGKKSRVRRVTPSEEAINSLSKYKDKHDIIGHIAVNPPEIENKIRMQKASILREMAMMNPGERRQFIDEGPIDFCDHANKKKYYIICRRCNEKTAYVWADNETLENWCDLHYLCSYDRITWYGAMAINVSPIDGKIGIECTCGEDTRDFRVNKTMPPIQKQMMIYYSQKHRGFGKNTSAYAAIQAL